MHVNRPILPLARRALRTLAAGFAVLALCTAPALVLAPATAYAETEYRASEEPELGAKSALLIDRDTNTVLLSKDADAKRYPASTTKVMTALLVLENANLDDTVTISQSDFDELDAQSAVAGLKAGEKISVRDLLACLLLPSGNESAYALARHVAGDTKAFADMMNERAEELDCTGTHFVNPCGLHDDDHYTTAQDMGRIFAAALEIPEFVEIAGSYNWDLPKTNKNDARELTSTNKLAKSGSSVFTQGVEAGKTGFTDKAGRCLVTAASQNNMRLMGVVLGSPDGVDQNGVEASFTDMYELLHWGFNAWTTGKVFDAGEVLMSAPVALSDDGESVGLLADGSITATVPAETGVEDLTFKPTWTEEIQAPVDEKQEIGTVKVSLGDRDLGSVKVVAATAMSLSIFKWMQANPMVIVAILVAAIALVVLLSTLVSRRRQRNQHRYSYQVPNGRFNGGRSGSEGMRPQPGIEQMPPIRPQTARPTQAAAPRPQQGNAPRPQGSAPRPQAIPNPQQPANEQRKPQRFRNLPKM